MDGNVDFVFRALPGAAELSWEELNAQINSAFSAVLRKIEAR